MALARALILFALAATNARAGDKLQAADCGLGSGGCALSRSVVEVAGSTWATNQVGFPYRMRSSIGQVGNTLFTGTGARFNTGYMPLAAQPANIAAITVSSGTKTNGSLELGFTAPGFDGALASSGSFRVAYSSNPSDPLDASSYGLSVATTNAAPGSMQSIVIPGLLPNTTYYCRIFPTDASGFAAESSPESDESTLADAPVNVSTSATDTTAQLRWDASSGGSAGYHASTTSSSGSGAVDVSSAASFAGSGAQISLNVTGLAPNTTYYFKVANLNWQSQRTSYATIVSVLTAPTGAPLPVTISPTSVIDVANRTVELRWAYQPFVNPGGVLVLVSKTPTAFAANGSYSAGQTLSDGSVVKSTGLVTGIADAGLSLHTTYFYHLLTENTSHVYSVDVTTAVFLDLPPMAPTALSGTLSGSSTSFALSWSPVKSSDDGTPFFSSTAAIAEELSSYKVYRSTAIVGPSWTFVQQVSTTTTQYTDTLPVAGQRYLYKVEAVSSRGLHEASVGVDTERNLYVYSVDGITRLQVPAELLGELTAAGNKYGTDIVLRISTGPTDAGQGLFNTAFFQAYGSPGNAPINDFTFSRPALVSLAYGVDGSGQVTAPTVSAAAAAPAQTIAAANAARNLGMYWYNGAKYVKLFGQVDPAAHTVTVASAFPGQYQVRALARTQGLHFDLSQLSNKFITPNGDGLNDTAVFVFDNPFDSAISGKIFDLRGGFVADMSAGPINGAGTGSLQWDGKSNGRVVSGGAYVYQIRAEDKVFSGTLVVVR
ncbi:MAG: fibronectin type III domain-containing protein [Elusimicrobia bacterium]|nr:fibronectin type III domain-containing protein [Elusimicrobiota bacterium]